jgi:chitin synthase
MGLLAIILLLMGGVGFLTFGFQATVCGKPPNQWAVGTVDNRMVIINGLAYNLTDFKHPKAGATFDGTKSPIVTPGFNVGAQDVSFMFQKVNGSCNGIITPASNSFIPSTAGNLRYYFPCNTFSQFGNSQLNRTGYDSAFQCHASSHSRDLLNNLKNTGLVSYNWTQITDGSRNLAVFKS